MIDCYRDDSVMQHIAIGVSDGIAAVAKGHLRQAMKHWIDRRNVTSLGAVLEAAPLWRRLV